MPTKIEIMQELDRRGQLPPDKKAILDELKRRGAIQPGLGFNDIRIPTPEQEALQTNKTVSYLEKGVLPTAGAIFGSTAGTATKIPGGAIIGESIGAGAGEGLNQLLGITDPSLTQIGINAAIPPATRAVAGTGRWLIKQLGQHAPGASIALQEQAIKDAQNATNLIDIPAPSKSLYNELKKMKPEIKLGESIDTANELLEQESEAFKGLKYPKVGLMSKDMIKKSSVYNNVPVTRQVLSQLIDSHGKPIVIEVTEMEKVLKEGENKLSFPQMWGNIKRIGRRISQTRAQGGEEYGAYKKLYSGMWEDLNSAADHLPTDVGGMLKEANNAYRREMAREDLAAQVTKAIEPQAQTAIPYIKPKIIYNWLTKSKDAEFFKNSMSPEEYKSIVSLFEEMIKTPPLPPPPGANVGSYRMIGKLAAGAAGGYYATKSPLGALAGSAITTYGPQIISQALMSDTGRALLKRMISQGFSMDYRTLAILAEAIGATVTSNIKEPTNLMGNISKINASDVTPSEMEQAIQGMRSYKKTLPKMLGEVKGAYP